MPFQIKRTKKRRHEFKKNGKIIENVGLGKTRDSHLFTKRFHNTLKNKENQGILFSNISGNLQVL